MQQKQKELTLQKSLRKRDKPDRDFGLGFLRYFIFKYRIGFPNDS